MESMPISPALWSAAFMPQSNPCQQNRSINASRPTRFNALPDKSGAPNRALL